MAKVKVKVSASTIHELDTEDYVDAYEEKCQEDGEGPSPDGVPVEFALAEFEKGLENGDEDLGLILEDAPVEVKLQS